MIGVKVDATCEDGESLEKLQEVIEQRMKYLNETAEQSIAACAIDVLRSLRSATVVAKADKEKVEVKQDHNLVCVFKRAGAKRFPCLRVFGGNQLYNKKDNEVVCFTQAAKVSPKKYVYRWKPEHSKKRYIIVSDSQVDALAEAKKILSSRVKRFAGLAKLVLGVLMWKTNTIQPPSTEGTSHQTQSKANQTTTKHVQIDRDGIGSGTYTLELEDALRYAQDALKGGKAQIDLQLKKAMNKIVSVVNYKLKGDFFNSNVKLQPPFPELKSRK